MSRSRHGRLIQAWNRWWNPQSGTRPERLRAWWREYWANFGSLYESNASGTRPDTEEKRLRSDLFALKVATLGCLVIYAIMGLYLALAS
jgi:hypothetical protein